MAIPSRNGEFGPGTSGLPMEMTRMAVEGQRPSGSRSAQLALEALPVGVALVEPRGGIIGFNEAMRQVVGRPAEAHAMQFAQLWREDAWDVDDMLKTVMRARVWTDCALTSNTTGKVLRFKAQALCTEPERMRPNLLVFMHNCAHTSPLGEFPAVPNTQCRAEYAHQLRHVESEKVRLQRALAHESERRRELVHRVKNNLSILVSLVRVARARDASTGPDCALTTFEHRVHAMASAYSILDSEQSDGVCRLDEMLMELCANLRHAIATDTVQLIPSLEPVIVDLDSAISISLMVNELVTNAVKHAFPAARSGQIMVTLQRRSDGVRLRVADDGVGCGGEPHRPQRRVDEFGRSRRGSGSRIVESLVRKLHGEMTTGPYADGAAARQGHVCQIDFPLQQEQQPLDVA